MNILLYQQLEPRLIGTSYQLELHTPELSFPKDPFTMSSYQRNYRKGLVEEVSMQA